MQATVRTHTGEKEKPVAIINYNSNMGGVDVADQMLVAYSVECKRHKIRCKNSFAIF